MRLILFLVLSFFLITAGGCGYTSASLLPPELDSIHVDNFVNKIDPAGEVSDRRSGYSYRPGLENDITRAVIDGYIFDGNLGIRTADKAVLLLKGTLTDFRKFPLSYDNADNVEEFRIELSVDIELLNNSTGKLMWRENGFTGQSSYTVTGPNAKTEATALTEAVNDLAQRIVERTIEAW